MQNLKYYVLWKKDSKMLSYYLDKYYKKLISDLKDLSKSWFLTYKINKLLSKSDNRDFIMSPDQSSIINLSYLERIKKSTKWLNIDLYESKFEKELDLFLDGQTDKLIMNMWDKIWSTDIKLTTIDNDPFNNIDAHPDHRANGWVLWWWEAKKEDWLEVYEKTFLLLKKLDEWVYDELNQIIKKIIPLWTWKWLHNSASYKECVGHLYMWYTIDSFKPELNNLEAIIHESSHNKLNLLLQFDPCVLNDKQEKYYSPFRPDARHIHGVFLAIHAFVPTIYMLMVAYKKWFIWDDDHWLEKLVLYYIKNKITWKVLRKHAKFTELWEEIMQEVKYVMGLCDELFKEINPDKVFILRAKQRQIEHFNEVNRNYPILEY